MTIKAENKNQTIAIIDDDPDLGFLLKQHFQSQGHIVYVLAGDELLMDNLESLHPDLVFLDINMAGMSGNEICQLIRKNPKLSQSKVILMSGSHEIEKLALSCGADAFIRKPLSYAKFSNLELF